MRPTLILLHGWGFDADLWAAIADALAAYPIVRWDRGYFGDAVDGAVDGPVVGIGHSLGAMLLADALPRAAPLVAINGFDHFTGADAVPQRLVDRMRTRFAQAPVDVLNDFRARCDAPAAQGDLRERRLAADLELLATHRATATERPVLSLQSGADPILPEGLRNTVFPGAKRATQEHAGHLLPVTHATWCAHQIEAFLCR